MNFKGFLVGLYSFFSLLVAIILMLVLKNKIHKIRQIWAYTMLKVIGVKIEQIGKIDTTANIIVLNHNSMLDIIILDYLYPKEIAWMAKAKLAKIPIFGYIFKIPNLILIDKKNNKDIINKQVKEAISDNKTIGIFPEGTRGETNDIAKFKKGTKYISEKLNLTIQPIVLINTRKRLDTKTARASSGNIKLVCLEKITIENDNWYKDLENNMKTIYNNYSK